MDPNQQYQGQAGGNPNPYEFILNPQSPQKPKPAKGLGKNHFVLTIVLIVGGVAAFMIVAAILINALTPKKVSKADLIGLAQTQTELIRISDQGEGNARQQVTQNLAFTVDLSVQSQRQQITALLAKNGAKIGKKELALKQNADTDRKFTSARSTSTFDLVFSQVMQTQLEGYAKEIKNLYNHAVSKTEQDLMSGFYQQTQQLISQIPYAQDTINAAGSGQ